MKFFVRKFIKYLFIPFGLFYNIFNKQENKIVILMYHRVNDSINKELSVKKNNFIWQMKYLKKSKFNVISMDDAVYKIKSKNINGRYVVLTFDDGYEDFYYNAYPVLTKHCFPATMYLVPGFIEMQRTFWWDEDIGVSELMNWSQIYELCKSNLITIGSHTLNHPNLENKKDEGEIRYELEMSKLLLENRLKKSINHFCYPQGCFSKDAEKVAKEIYQTGVLIFNGKDITNSFDSNFLYRLKRIPVQNSDGKFLFISRLKGFLILEELIRKLIRK
jgi:peptidoglycan/xylan/chitin deacetylase (PgdA/CDA1 family)